MKYFLFFALFTGHYVVGAQSKCGNEWISGGGGQRIKFIGNNIQTNNSIYILTYFSGGGSNICDTSGKLILASDGYDVYDRLGNYIEDGDTLIPKDFYQDQDGWSSLSQTSIFLPMDSNKYYFITPTASDQRFADCLANSHCGFDLLLYNIIDMNANGGSGKVVKRMQPLMENAELSKTQMMACRHSNGKDWWLLKQGVDSNTVYKFLFTQDSVYNKGYQVFNSPNWDKQDVRGQSVFSVDGTQYASTRHGGSSGLIFLANFDRCYGILSNPKTIVMPIGSAQDPSDPLQTEHLSVGLAYSPNGKLLYVISRTNIYQYNLQDETWFHVYGKDTINNFQDYETAYLSPDNKIYIGNWYGLSKQMSRIDNPDIKGAGCNFCPRCLRLDSLSTAQGNFSVGTPPCMPNYSLGAKECWPLEVSTTNKEEPKLKSYPNPTSSLLTIELTTNKKGLIPIEIYNMVGELLLKTDLQSQTKVQINISSLPKGLYVIQCEGVSQKVVME